jgi:plastocyanin
MTMSRPMLILAAALAVGAAGCGDSGNESAGSTSAAGATAQTQASGAAAKLTVEETEFKLDPANPRLARPGVVEITARNAGSIPHALEVEGPKDEVKTGEIAPGESKTLKIDLSKPGRYELYCPIDGHKDKGMRGEVIVAGGGSGGASTTKTDQDSGGGGSGSGGSGY